MNTPGGMSNSSTPNSTFPTSPISPPTSPRGESIKDFVRNSSPNVVSEGTRSGLLTPEGTRDGSPTPGTEDEPRKRKLPFSPPESKPQSRNISTTSEREKVLADNGAADEDKGVKRQRSRTISPQGGERDGKDTTTEALEDLLDEINNSFPDALIREVGTSSLPSSAAHSRSSSSDAPGVPVSAPLNITSSSAAALSNSTANTASKVSEQISSSNTPEDSPHGTISNPPKPQQPGTGFFDTAPLRQSSDFWTSPKSTTAAGGPPTSVFDPNFDPTNSPTPSVSSNKFTPLKRVRKGDKNFSNKKENDDTSPPPPAALPSTENQQQSHDQSQSQSQFQPQTAQKIFENQFATSYSNPGKGYSEGVATTATHLEKEPTVGDPHTLVLLHISLVIPATLNERYNRYRRRTMKDVSGGVPSESENEDASVKTNISEDESSSSSGSPFQTISPIIYQRGILIPHPKSDYELLKQEIGKVLAVKISRNREVEGEPEFYDEIESGSEYEAIKRKTKRKKKWCMRVYARNGLLTKGAWERVWAEMERVDVEVAEIRRGKVTWGVSGKGRRNKWIEYNTEDLKTPKEEGGRMSWGGVSIDSTIRGAGSVSGERQKRVASGRSQRSVTQGSIDMSPGNKSDFCTSASIYEPGATTTEDDMDDDVPEPRSPTGRNFSNVSSPPFAARRAEEEEETVHIHRHNEDEDTEVEGEEKRSSMPGSPNPSPSSSAQPKAHHTAAVLIDVEDIEGDADDEEEGPVNIKSTRSMSTASAKREDRKTSSASLEEIFRRHEAQSAEEEVLEDYTVEGHEFEGIEAAEIEVDEDLIPASRQTISLAPPISAKPVPGAGYYDYGEIEDDDDDQWEYTSPVYTKARHSRRVRGPRSRYSGLRYRGLRREKPVHNDYDSHYHAQVQAPIKPRTRLQYIADILKPVVITAIIVGAATFYLSTFSSYNQYRDRNPSVFSKMHFKSKVHDLYGYGKYRDDDDGFEDDDEIDLDEDVDMHGSCSGKGSGGAAVGGGFWPNNWLKPNYGVTEVKTKKKIPGNGDWTVTVTSTVTHGILGETPLPAGWEKERKKERQRAKERDEELPVEGQATFGSASDYVSASPETSENELSSETGQAKETAEISSLAPAAPETAATPTSTLEHSSGFGDAAPPTPGPNTTTTSPVPVITENEQTANQTDSEQDQKAESVLEGDSQPNSGESPGSEESEISSEHLPVDATSTLKGTAVDATVDGIPQTEETTATAVSESATVTSEKVLKMWDRWGRGKW